MKASKVTENPLFSPDNPNLPEAVNDLVEQSGVMAIHSAVEAARAGGDQPAFGIAARELKRLAEECRQTADHIMDLLVQMDPASRDAVQCYSRKEVGEAIENIRAICRLACARSASTGG